MIDNREARETPPVVDEDEDVVKLQQQRARHLAQQLLLNHLTSLRLEKYSISAMRILLLVVSVLDAACIALGILISSLSLATSTSQVGGLVVGTTDYDTRQFVLYSEGITRTIAVTIIMIVLLGLAIVIPRYYQQKKREKLAQNVDSSDSPSAGTLGKDILKTALDAQGALARAAIHFIEQVGGVDTFQNKHEDAYLHFREHILLFLWAFVIALNPVCSVWGVVSFWEGILDSALLQYLSEFQIVFESKPLSESAVFPVSIVFTSIMVASFHFFLYGMIHFQDRNRAIKSIERLELKSKEDEKEYASEAKHSRMPGEGMEGLADFNQKEPLSLRVRRMSHDVVRRSRKWLRGIQSGLLWDLEWSFTLPLVFYLGVSIGAGLSLGFNPSFAPVVSIITLIRVCTLNSTDVLRRGNDTILNFNKNIFYVSYVSDLSPDFGFCSRNQPVDNTGFVICIACGVLAALDCYFFVLLVRKSFKTRYGLSLLPYDSTRSNQLGFAYFRMLTFIAGLSLFVLSIVICCVQPITSYLIQYVVVTPVTTSQANSSGASNVQFVIRPFTQVGIGPLVYGFGCFYLILATHVAQITFGFLPLEVLRNESAMQLALESDVQVLSGLVKEEEANSTRSGVESIPFSPAASTVSKQHDSSPSAISNSPSLTIRRVFHPVTKSTTALELQIESNVFVLETAISMYHFMSLSYDLTVLERTDEEMDILPKMQELVEDKRFKICLYAQDKATDTHAFVFVSDDRIVVSFRGSVSFQNYKTDWESTGVESEHGKVVEPLLDDEVNLAYSKRLASRKAYVHGGFVKTYETVKEDIRAKVKELLIEGGKPRCVFVTGHSLGGGLAIVCAFDLGVALNIPINRLALMTWGCPKVGTFAFVKRVHRIVRCAHRIATANDVITQLPFEDPLADWHLRGWHHVGTEIILLPSGNMVIRPSPIERFMIHKLRTSMTAHFRLNYAVALAAWVIRTNPDMRPQWWMSTINKFTMFADFSPIPTEIRDALLWDLRRPGAAYFLGSQLVRDQAVDTLVVMESTLIANRQEFIRRLILAAELDEAQFQQTVKAYLDEEEEEEEFRDALSSDSSSNGKEDTSTGNRGVDTTMA